MSSAGSIDETPALLTRTAAVPKRSCTAAANAPTSASELTSPATASVSAPGTSAGGSTSISASAYPACASTSATRRPMPRAEPVTTATTMAGSSQSAGEAGGRPG